MGQLVAAGEKREKRAALVMFLDMLSPGLGTWRGRTELLVLDGVNISRRRLCNTELAWTHTNYVRYPFVWRPACLSEIVCAGDADMASGDVPGELADGRSSEEVK